MSAARLGLVAILLVVAAYGTMVQGVGCSQTAHLSFARELTAGTASIDRLHWFTCDKSYIEGHFYAAKSPGLGFVSAPLYLAMDAAGVAWTALPPYSHPDSLYTVEPSTIWPFTLWAATLPALALLLLVRRRAEEGEPGYGTLAAVSLGVATLVLPYSTLYASHVPAALCAFAAFVLAERSGRAGSAPLALAAGVLGGLAIFLDAPFGLAVVLIGVYAAFAARPVARSLAYAAGAAIGALPLFIFNWWALGSPLRVTYESVVIHQGQTGHDRIGYQDAGFFGITVPRWRDAVELLLAPKGLLALTPLAAVAAAGLVLLWRRRRRAEALFVAAVAVSYLAYNAGYFQPFGGASAGARFLLPVVVFLALPLAAAYRQWPLTTGVLAVVSGVWAAAATLTLPLLEVQESGEWLRRLADAQFMPTVVTLLGGGQHWPAMVPFLALLAAAAALAVKATPGTSRAAPDARAAVAALAGWAAIYAWSTRLLEATALELAAAMVVAAAAVVGTLVAYRPQLLGVPVRLRTGATDT
jgi:hypothetical protein